MKWFKLYVELAYDPKVRRLPEEIAFRWILLLCFKAEGTLDQWSIDDVAFQLRLDKDEMNRTIELLETAGLITVKDNKIDIPNWTKRQRTRDYSTERVRRYRKRKRETNQSVSQVFHSVSETEGNEMKRAIDIDIDKEKDKEEDKEENKEKKYNTRLAPTENAASQLFLVPPSPKEERKTRVAQAAIEVFNAWTEIFEKSAGRVVFNRKRREKITARLNEGYSVEDLIQALKGARLSPWHMGFNPDNKVYDDIVTILRDGVQVEKFRDIYSRWVAAGGDPEKLPSKSELIKELKEKGLVPKTEKEQQEEKLWE